MSDWVKATDLATLQAHGRWFARLGVADVALFCIDGQVSVGHDAPQ